MRTLAIVGSLVAALALAACDPTNPSPDLVREKIVVVRPDGSFYYCPTMAQMTEAGINQLTDRQVARIIAELHRNNMICRQSLEAVKKYLEDAAERLER